jgi:hypothetical protein
LGSLSLLRLDGAISRQRISDRRLRRVCRWAVPQLCSARAISRHRWLGVARFPQLARPAHRQPRTGTHQPCQSSWTSRTRDCVLQHFAKSCGDSPFRRHEFIGAKTQPVARPRFGPAGCHHHLRWLVRTDLFCRRGPRSISQPASLDDRSALSCIFIFLLVNAALFHVLHVDRLMGSQTPAAEAAMLIFEPLDESASGKSSFLPS